LKLKVAHCRQRAASPRDRLPKHSNVQRILTVQPAFIH
jgi:hypothetical protein